MVDIGHFALVCAWLFALYGMLVGVGGSLRQNERLVSSSRNALYLVTFFSILSLVSLAVLFLGHDYRYNYVWRHSNNAMHSAYLISAVWGGMDGSMLLWAVLGTLYASCAVYYSQAVPRRLLGWSLPILNGSNLFFLTVVLFLTNPFRLIPGGAVPTDGRGLNPLLQNPSMLIHPPSLYLGFTGFVVPFAFCLGALLSGDLSDTWTRATRRWTLIAWAFLTIGIILGGNWAYIELGWGGFWAWDPVENASFLPWLTGTALLHSIMVQGRRGMLKVWNVFLAVLTYGLAVFGTFLTRSGVVQSVHAFAETDVGWVFLAYLGAVAALSLVLMVWRFKSLRAENRLESYLSREAAFLFNNLILLAICFATFWGVMYPVFSEALTGEKSVVGPPFFNQVNVPLFLILLFLMGAGPLIAWKRNSVRQLGRVFLVPLVSGSLVTLLFLWIDIARLGAALGFGLSVFVLASVSSEFRRGAKARREITGHKAGIGIVELLRRRPQRYGGLVVHLGVAIMAISITASMVYKVERDFSIKPSESYTLSRYRLQLVSLESQRFPNYEELVANIEVFDAKDGTRLGSLRPERRYYFASEETTTEVDIRMTPRDDLYLALAGLDAAPGTSEGDSIDLKTASAAFKGFVNPLQVWLWFGGVVVMCGAVVVIFGALKDGVSLKDTHAVRDSAAIREI